MKLHAAVVISRASIIKKKQKTDVSVELVKLSSLTVSSGRALELGLQGEQSHVPHQSGLRDHQARVISLQNRRSCFSHILLAVLISIVDIRLSRLSYPESTPYVLRILN